MYKLVFMVPAEYLEAVKAAVFEVGAGRIGAYEQCSWQCLGQGQFKPMQGSEPFLGRQGQLEQVDEYRVEMVCEDKVIAAAVTALKAAHPYEMPAFDIIKLESEISLPREN